MLSSEWMLSPSLISGPYGNHFCEFPSWLYTYTVAFSIVANANISTSVPHVPSDIMLLVCRCSAMFGDTCLIVVRLSMMYDTVIVLKSPWSSWLPVKILLNVLKRQFPSPLILDVLRGLFVGRVLMSLTWRRPFPRTKFSLSREHISRCHPSHTAFTSIESTAGMLFFVVDMSGIGEEITSFVSGDGWWSASGTSMSYFVRFGGGLISSDGSAYFVFIYE